MAQRIVPNLWCDGNAVEAARWYTTALPTTTITSALHYPDSGLPAAQQHLAGNEVTVDLSISGYRITLINAGNEFTPTPAISFILNFDEHTFGGEEQAALDRTWAALTDGGTELLPLGEYPFSARYAMVQDRYGTTWQLRLADAGAQRRPFVVPALMFGAAAQNRAADAVTTWVDLFQDSDIGSVARYPEDTGPATATSWMFGEFTLAGQWFAAMDAGVEQSESFTPGVSLYVNCDDQDEIDRLWHALSSVPDAEQCGWCVDQFGLSWQIAPSDVAELLEIPGAFMRMTTMRKLDIAVMRGD